MSVFKVQLNYPGWQGQLDLNPATATPYQAEQYSNLGSQMQPSIQRTIFVTGPGRTYRKLFDGQTFTDCNYWKRFAYPQVPYDQAFISVVTDDGSIYSDVAQENTFPYVFNVTAIGGTAYASNVVDILGTTGGAAVFCQIANQTTQSVSVRINGNVNAVFTLGSMETQVFNPGDLAITKLEFDNHVSGSSTATIQVLVSVLSVCNS